MREKLLALKPEHEPKMEKWHFWFGGGILYEMFVKRVTIMNVAASGREFPEPVFAHLYL